MAPELEMGVLGLGMGVLELGIQHHNGMEAFSTSSSSSAAYGSCSGAGGGGGQDAYLYGLLPTPDSNAAVAAAGSFPPVDDLLDFSLKDGFFAAAGTDVVSSYTFHGHGSDGAATQQRHQLFVHQQHPQYHAAAAIYGASAPDATTGNYSLFVDQQQHYRSSSAGSDLAAFPDDLYIPSEEAAELEWLSKFVDDSRDVPFHIPGISTAGTGFATTAAAAAAAAATTANSNSSQYNNTNSGSSSHAPTAAGSTAAAATIIARADPTGGVIIPGRARTKRSRVTAPPAAAAAAAVIAAQMGPASLTWSTSHPLASPSSSSSSSSETKQPRTPGNVGKKKRDVVPPAAAANTPAAGGILAERGGGGGGLRKCTHCSSDKTPQWRTGPLGPKTLCNACGVRYKSGRLVPEYRPASSPTFVLTQHSNSHRKVMELRRQKEMLMRHHHHHHHQQQQMQSHDAASPRGGGMAPGSIPVAGVMVASTRPDMLLRDFEVC